MNEKYARILRKTGGVALIILGLILSAWLVYVFLAVVSFWLINRGLFMLGAPSLWVYLQRLRDTVKFHLG